MKTTQIRLLKMAVGIFCWLPFGAIADIYKCVTHPSKIVYYSNVPQPGVYGRCGQNADSKDSDDKYICDFVTEDGQQLRRPSKNGKEALEKVKCWQLKLEPILSKSPSRWETVSIGENFITMVDRQSITTKGGNKKAWFRTDHEKPQKYFNKPYNNAKTLYFFNCSERTMATAQNIFYMNEESINLYSKTLNSTDFAEVAPDTTGEAMLNYICHNPKSKQ